MTVSDGGLDMRGYSLEFGWLNIYTLVIDIHVLINLL